MNNWGKNPQTQAGNGGNGKLLFFNVEYFGKMGGDSRKTQFQIFKVSKNGDVMTSSKGERIHHWF